MVGVRSRSSQWGVVYVVVRFDHLHQSTSSTPTLNCFTDALVLFNLLDLRHWRPCPTSWQSLITSWSSLTYVVALMSSLRETDRRSRLNTWGGLSWGRSEDWGGKMRMSEGLLSCLTSQSMFASLVSHRRSPRGGLISSLIFLCTKRAKCGNLPEDAIVC